MTDKNQRKILEDFRVAISNIIALFIEDSDNIFFEDIESKAEIVSKLERLFEGSYRIHMEPDYLFSTINELNNAYSSLETEFNNNQRGESFDRKGVNGVISYLIRLVNRLENEFIESRNRLAHNIDQEKVYNSMKFLEERIESINKERVKLKETIAELVKENEISQLQKEELKLKEAELNAAANKIEYYQKELELRQKQQDAVDQWESTIEKTFEKLKDYLEPIDSEHIRLKQMFKIYRWLAATIVFALIGLEIISCCKIYNAIDFPDFKNYIVLFIPVPIAGGLLWAFICQMNRAQRQMVILSRYKHEIQYVEGLLFSINSLSPSIDEAVKRINLALDRMIDNHLSIGTKDVFTEDRFLNEEKKDGMPYDVVMKILGAFKDIAKKS